MKDIEIINIAAQISYQEATQKTFASFALRTNIKAKIRKWDDHASLLKRFLNKENVEQKSKTEALKILRVKRRLFKSLRIPEYEESIIVYQKNIDIHQNRKENRQYELFTRRFYRSLENETEGEIKVPTDEVKEYWNTMWCEKENEYLLHYDLQEQQVVFPLFMKFLEIVKFPPNWKSAGIDGIYNFFIKKLRTLHIVLFEMIKDMCMNEKTQDIWFYQEITHLIPKGNPEKENDFRPITCISNIYKLTTKCVTEVM